MLRSFHPVAGAVNAGIFLGFVAAEDVGPRAGTQVMRPPLRGIDAWGFGDPPPNHWFLTTCGCANVLSLLLCSSDSRCGRAWLRAKILVFRLVVATLRISSTHAQPRRC